MLNFYRISCVNDPLFANFYNLYTLAFTPENRRSRDGLEYELTNEKCFCAHALVQNDKFVGFFNYWTFDRFYYIEHIAVVPSMRGKNIGTQAMEIFKSQTKLPVVLEVEMPTNTPTIRRIHFYEKLGFSVISHKYAQPPYERDGFLIPMELMSTDLHFANSHFELIKEILYKNVYHFETEKEKDLEIRLKL
jgi:ribosomal protein S18 acetylase RimI-like enzyme